MIAAAWSAVERAGASQTQTSHYTPALSQQSPWPCWETTSKPVRCNGWALPSIVFFFFVLLSLVATTRRCRQWKFFFCCASFSACLCSVFYEFSDSGVASRHFFLRVRTGSRRRVSSTVSASFSFCVVLRCYLIFRTLSSLSLSTPRFELCSLVPADVAAVTLSVGVVVVCWPWLGQWCRFVHGCPPSCQEAAL